MRNAAVSTDRRVVVIGGGLAGLVATYELSKLGYAPLLLERGGHLGGKVMSSEGYGGMPIEHGVHGWWKGYGNFFDVLRELHGADWQRECFSGPYYSRFVARMAGGKLVSTNRPPPIEGEPRVMPFVRAMTEMVKQGALSWGDVGSVVRLLARIVGFEHARDYDRWKGCTASGVAEELGVGRRAQELILANFTLASFFSPLDRISASAFFSSLHFYVFDAQASLAARWLRTHPAKLVHEPLAAAIAENGGVVSPYSRVLGLARDPHTKRVDTVFVDRAHTGLVERADLGPEPRDLLDDALPWSHTKPAQLALARATLQHFDHVWLRTERAGDVLHVKNEPVAWTGDRAPPTELRDPRWLEVEWGDTQMKRVRVLERCFETIGTICASDVPEGGYTEILWDARTEAKMRTPREELVKIRASLARHAHLFAMHVSDLTTPPHLPLYVGAFEGKPHAVAGICTHFGGRLRWSPNLHSFACQLHGSRFACDGQRTCGPAESDLFTFRVVPSASDPAMLDIQVPLPPRIKADHVVLATDVAGLRRIIQASPTLHDAPAAGGLMHLRTASVTVVRFAIGRRIDDTLCIFSGFTALDALFNVTKLQGVQLDRYKDRVHEIIEIQIYRDRTVGELSREPLVAAIKKELMEVYGWSEEPEILDPVHIAVHRDVYSSFDCESDAVRPGTTAPGLDGLTFAGDWVQPDEGAWFMERAVRTGRLAARAVARDDGADPERVPLVPPVRDPWNLRTIFGEGEGGIERVGDRIRKLVGIHDEPY